MRAEPHAPVPAPAALGCARPSVAAPESNQRLPRRERSNKACGKLSLWGKRGNYGSCGNCSWWDSAPGRAAARERREGEGRRWGGDEPLVSPAAPALRFSSGPGCSCSTEPTVRPRTAQGICSDTGEINSQSPLRATSPPCNSQFRTSEGKLHTPTSFLTVLSWA